MERYNFAKKIKSKLLCSYEDGHALNEGTISSLIVKFKKAHPFINSKFHFHCLKHKFITLSAYGGIPMIQLKDIVGHSNTKVTEQVYYHSSNTKNLESISKIKLPLNIKK